MKRRVAVAALGLLVACGGGGGAPRTESDFRTGDTEELARTDDWILVTQDSPTGYCLQLFTADESEDAVGCGFDVPELRRINYMGAEIGGHRYLLGPIAEEGVAVCVELADGSCVEAQIVQPDGSTPKVYVAEVPDGVPERVVVFGPGDVELDAVQTSTDPWVS